MKIKSFFLITVIFLLLFNSLGLQSAFSATDEKKYIIGTKKEVDLKPFKEQHGLKNNKVKKVKNTNLFITTLKPNEFLELKKYSDIRFIEEDAPVELTSTGEVVDDHEETIPWGMKEIGVDQAIEHNQKGDDIKIAIIDTGINSHPDLNLAGGVSFVEDITSYDDDNGHGTHVAGTVAAINNNIGVVGSASKSDIYAVKVLNNNGTGTISQVIEGIEWSIDNNINIISMSLGSQENSQALHEIIKQAYNNGILIVAAAGNRGKGSNTLLYPANYPEVLSVGATDENHKRANFSSTGPLLDIVAPGVNILSTTSNGGYGILSGTSMATPHVTGAAAAIWAKDINLTNEDVENILIQSATPLGERNEYGNGLVNLAKALGIIDTSIITPNPDLEPPSQINGDFDINAYDRTILSLSKKLHFLKEQASLANNVELAKEIENKYNDLIVRNAALHKIPDKYTTLAKNDTNTQALINEFHSSNYIYYTQIQKEYEESITHYASIIESISNQDVEITACCYVGGNQTINPGQSAYVSLKLSAPKDYVYINVYDSSGARITGTTYSNQPANTDIGYSWSTSPSTPVDTYSIVYTYSGTSLSDTFTIYVRAPIPSPPSALRYTPYINSINLYWDAASGATSYILKKDGVTVGSTTSTSYTFTGLSPDSSYELSVASSNSGGTSSYAFIGASTLSNVQPVPGIPIGLSTNVSTNDITLSWSPVSGATSYTVQRDGVTVGTTTSTSYPFSGLSDNTTYTLGVAASNSSGTSTFATKSATTLGIPIPTNLSTMSTDSSLTLSWTGVSGATSYSLQKNGVTVGTTTGTSYTFSSLSPSTTYTLGVAATTANGTSSFVTISPTTQPSGMQVLQVDNPVDISLPGGAYQVFKFTPTSSGTYKLFTGPYGGIGSSNDTVLEVYSDASLSNRIGYNDDSNGNLFSEIKISFNAGITYYIKLRHYNTTSGSVHSRITVTQDISPATNIMLDNSIEVSVGQNEFKVFKFTPSRGGKYKIFTSFLNINSDSYIHLYDDPNLTNQIAFNDDANGTYYSEMQVELNAGKEYYIKFRGFNNNSATALLTVTNIYFNVETMIQTAGNSTPESFGMFARDYNGGVYVNLIPEEETLSEFTPEYYFIENGQYWFDIHRLSYYMNIFLSEDGKVVMESGEDPTDSLTEDDIIDGYGETTLIVEESTTDIESSSIDQDVNKSSYPRAITYFGKSWYTDSQYLVYSSWPKFHLGSKPTSRTYSHTVFKGNTRNGTYETYQTKVETKMGKSSIKVPLGETGYYKYKVKVTSYFPSSTTMYVNQEIGPILINKVGDLYPNYKDKQSGIKLWMPPANLNKDLQTRSSTYRSKFIEYYESNWGSPIYFNWTDVEIHHMRPLEFGGSNDISNLIPLNSSSGTSAYVIRHQYLTSWWSNY